MGASQSSEFRGMTQFQTDEGRAMYIGQFVLNQAEQRANSAIHDLLTIMLGDNNLFSLEKMLSTQEGCKSLFLVLSSTLQKEFNILRLPDPTYPDNSQLIMYMSKSEYEKLSDDSSRAILCKQIVSFVLRLLTLVTALSSSIKLNSKLSTILFEPTETRTMNPNFKMPRNLDLQGREPIPREILETFVASGNLRHVTIGNEADPPDARPLYMFLNQDGVVIDSRLRVVYMRKGRETAVMELSITPMEPVKRPEMNIHQGYRYPQQPQPQQYPGMLPGQVYMGRPQFGGRRTYRRRANRRRTRNHRGGAPNTFFNLVLRKLDIHCQGICADIPMILDLKGNTYEKTAFQTYMMNPNPTEKDLPVSIRFSDRMEQILRAEKPQYPLDDPKEAQVSKGFANLSDRTMETKKAFDAIVEQMNSSGESVCPSAYRAFLLASRMDGEKLNTMVCHDKWAGKRTTDTIAYSLLQALFNDRVDGTMETSTATQCAEVVHTFLAEKVVRVSSPDEGTPSSFKDIVFSNTVSESLPLCVDKQSGPKPIQSKEQYAVLTQAHKRLRDMYQEHLKDCRDLVGKVITVRNDSVGKPVLQLNEVFTTHTRGAMVALNELISQARVLLTFHYLEVEKVYTEAIETVGTLSVAKM